MDDLVVSYDRAAQVTALQVYYADFYNWEVFFGLFYSKLKKVKIYQVFESSIGTGC